MGIPSIIDLPKNGNLWSSAFDIAMFLDELFDAWVIVLFKNRK
jgi:hypothetical protein